MAVEFTVVSIGTLSSNPLWNEPPGLRTPHATTTLVADGDRRVLVDPSLPAAVVVSRLFERTGLKPEQITHVFCTTLRPTHRRGIEAFGSARWLCHGPELEAYRTHLEGLAESSERMAQDLAEPIAADRELLNRFAAAPEKITPAAHLYPLPGPSAGGAGLLLAEVTRTILIAGDAALTRGHVEAGRVWTGCADANAAIQSLQEIIGIADVIVCGHDNLMLSPTRWLK